MKKIKCLLLILLLFSLTACTNSISTMSNKIVDISEKNDKKYEINMEKFNCGSYNYTAPYGKTMPYNVEGIIGMPKGDEKFPLALIIHGSHENIDENKKFYDGFEYLVKKLSENGYVALSLDVSKAYIWKYGDNDDPQKITEIVNKHLQSLKLANEGEKNNYNIDLKGKIDFENVALIGHSRGAETIFKVANEQIKAGQPIKSLLSIAPTAFLNDKEFPDVDTSILVPEYDGDVVDLSGSNIYDILSNSNRKSFTALTILERANHNYFNAVLDKNDALLLGKDLSNQVSKDEQINFLSSFAVDFLNASIKNDVKDTLYDFSVESPNKMYGLDVKTILTGGKKTDIIDVKNIDNFTVKDASVEKIVDSWFYKNDKAIGFESNTFGNDKYMTRDLINIKWNKKGQSISFAPMAKDFSSFSNLSIDMALDPSDKLNKNIKNQRFTIGIEDKKGDIINVSIDNDVNALSYVDGKLDFTEIEDKKIYFWSEKTPLTSFRVPLSNIKEIDLKNISKIHFNFDKTDSGSVMMSSIRLE